MKKDGDWIAALGADLRVSRVDVAASPMLDLVEVFVSDRAGAERSCVYYFDCTEGRRLYRKLRNAVGQLEQAQYELSKLEQAGPDPSAGSRGGSPAA